jgi:nucleoside 2-deoxyribosyltransferase
MPGKPIVYCAGPMFSPADKWEQEQIAAVFKEDKRFETFLPQRDGIELKAVMERLNDPQSLKTVMLFIPVIRRAVFALDLFQVVERCDCVVFNMNGRDPDDGGIVEAATAFIAGKGVVLYKNTPVSFIAGEDNPMIDGLAYDWTIVDSWQAIPQKVEDTLEAIRRRDDRSVSSIPPVLSETLELGRKIWLVLQALRAGWTATVPELIAQLPALIAADAPIAVDKDRRVHIKDLTLGSLSECDERTVDAIKALWAKFCEGVKQVDHRVRGLVERMQA